MTFDPECLVLADHFLMPIVKDVVRNALAEHLQREAEEWLLQHERTAEDGSVYYALDNDLLWAGGILHNDDDIGMKYGPSPDKASIVAMLDEGEVLVECGDCVKAIAIMRQGQLVDI